MSCCWECLPIPLEAGRLTLGRTYTYIMKSRLVISFDEVADRERKHSGEEVSGHLGASGKEVPGHPSGESPGRSWAYSLSWAG